MPDTDTGTTPTPGPPYGGDLGWREREAKRTGRTGTTSTQRGYATGWEARAERLEAALREIAELHRPASIVDARRIARRALEKPHV